MKLSERRIRELRLMAVRTRMREEQDTVWRAQSYAEGPLFFYDYVRQHPNANNDLARAASRELLRRAANRAATLRKRNERICSIAKEWGLE